MISCFSPGVLGDFAVDSRVNLISTALYTFRSMSCGLFYSDGHVQKENKYRVSECNKTCV